MKFFDLIKALTKKKIQPKDYTELSLFDELDNLQQQAATAGQTKTVNGKTYTLQPSSHPGWLRWMAADGEELYTDEKTGETGDPNKKDQPKQEATPNTSEDHAALYDEFKKRVFDDERLYAVMNADNSEQAKRKMFDETLRRKATDFVRFNVDFYKKLDQVLKTDHIPDQLFDEYKDHAQDVKRRIDNSTTASINRMKRADVLNSMVNDEKGNYTGSIDEIYENLKRTNISGNKLNKTEIRQIANELVEAGNLERYTGPDGEERYRVLNWNDTSKVNPDQEAPGKPAAAERPKNLVKIEDKELQSSFDELVNAENLDSIALKEMIDQYLFSDKTPLQDDVIRLLPQPPSLMQRRKTADRLSEKIVDLAEKFRHSEKKKIFSEVNIPEPEAKEEPKAEPTATMEEVKPEPAAVPEPKTTEPTPAKAPEPEGEYEEDLFGNKIYKVGNSRFALVNKEDGKPTLTRVPKKPEQPEKKAAAGPEPGEDLFSQLQEQLRKPQEQQSQPKAVESTTQPEKATPEPKLEEKSTVEPDTMEDPEEDDADEIRFGAEGLQGGKKGIKEQRELINKQVDEILKKEDKDITDEDKKILAKYSGRGGTDEISLNEYYTRSDQASFVWDCAIQLGFRGGSVLEPSTATGVFIHTAPPNAIVTGVELEEKSSRIARLLHGDKHEIINSSFEAFNAKNPGEKYDLVIGNCPFGIRGATVMQDPEGRHHNTADQYFVERSINKLKDNGILAMIVPTGIMDNPTNSDLRNELNKQAEFLGAFRMPTGAFKHAGAEVATDIVYFRKRPAEAANFLVNADAETISKLQDLGIMDHEFTSGRFFAKNPEFTMGKKTKGNYGRDTWTGKFDIEELRSKAELLKPHKDNYEALKEYGIDIEKQSSTPGPKVGEVRTINGRQYRFNQNHRWERVSDGFTGEVILTDREQEVAKELNLTPPEFMKLRKNIDIDGLHLTDEQRAVVAHNPEYNKGIKEVKGLVNIPLNKFEKCKAAALLGIAIQKYEELKQDPRTNREEVWSNAKKLEGKINEFIEKHGNPADLTKYLNKGESKAIQTLYSTVDGDGKISDSITDPYNENQKETKGTQTQRNFNDLKSVEGTIKELHELGGDTHFEEFTRYYQGDDEITKDNFDLKMLRNDEIGITEDGKYAPVQDVYFGQVSDKLDAWKSRMESIEAELQTSLDPGVTERLSAEKAKLENQIRTLREKAGFKTISDLPIRMSDVKDDMFDIEILNEYLKTQEYNFDLVIDPDGKLNFADALYAQIYELYHDKGDLDEKGVKELKNMLDQYFPKRTNPFELTFLNDLNGIPVTKYEDDAEEKTNNIEAGFNSFLANREEAPEIEEKFNRLYNNWIMKDYDEDVIEGIEKLDYDKKLNRYAPDGHQLTIRESISPNQWGSIRRLVDQGKGMLAHGVGVGKTLQAIVSIAIMKQEGKCQKPLVVTPKSVLLNWNDEANLWLKDANVLVVGYRKDKNGKYTIKEQNPEIRSKLIEIQRNGHNYDLILMTRDDFVGIGFSEETRDSMIDKLVSKYFPSTDKLTKAQKKRMESMKQRIATNMSGLNTKFSGINFEDLGVDLLVRDESHDCKNLFVAEDYKDVTGLSGTDSLKPLHNYIASTVIREQNDNRNVIMLTATPVSNTPLEIFNMLLPFAENELDKMKIRSLDDFVRRFAKIDTQPTMDADGSVSTKRKFVGFNSIDILRKMFFRFADYKTHKDVKGQNIKFPKENPIHEYTELNEGQKQILEHCRMRLWANRLLSRSKMIKARNGDLNWDGDIEMIMKDLSNPGEHADGTAKVDPITQALKDGALTKEDVEVIKDYAAEYMDYWLDKNAGVKDDSKLDFDGFFKIQSDMIKATGDVAWYKEASTDYAMQVDDEFVNKHTSLAKLNRLTELVSDEYKNGGKQVIFAINLHMHDKIKEELVKAGIKPEEIKIVNANTVSSASARLQVTKDFNSGKYKVVIGNYATMGEGLNFNNGTTKGYHLQPPWNSLAYEQGNGRFIRQGNPNETVDVHYMLTRGSIDAFMTQKVLDKKDMVERFLKGDSNNWEEDIALSADDILIELARDPEEAKRLMEVKRKNQERANAEYDKKKKLRKLSRYHSNIRDMKKIKDKTSIVYQRLQKENESIENEFNSAGEEYAKYLDAKRKIYVDDKSGMGLIIPEGTMLTSSGGEKIYVREIDHENRTVNVLYSSGKIQSIPFSAMAKNIKDYKITVTNDAGDYFTNSIAKSKKSAYEISHIMDNFTDPDMFTKEQLDTIRGVVMEDLNNPWSKSSDFYTVDTEKNELIEPSSYYLKKYPERYKIVFPADKEFEELVIKAKPEVISVYAKRPVMSKYYRELTAGMFPTTHTPPATLTEIENLYKRARRVSDESYRDIKYVTPGHSHAERVRKIYTNMKKGNYEGYSELLSSELKEAIQDADSEAEIQSLIRDPEFISKLNFARQYSYHQDTNYHLSVLFDNIPEHLLKTE